MWAVFEIGKPHAIPSSLSLFLVGGGSPQLFPLLCLPPAAMIPYRDVRLFFWNYKPCLPSGSCLAHGVLSDNRKLANTPTLSSMENR